MTNREGILLSFFATDIAYWKHSLPPADRCVAYVARGTTLCSRWPLFCCAYELWNILDGIVLDSDGDDQGALAQLRMILQVLWDAGSMDHVGWEVGRDDLWDSRWDDYWQVIHALACKATPNRLLESKVDLNQILGIVEIRHVEGDEGFLLLKNELGKE